MNASPYLERIERYSSHVINDARSVALQVRQLPMRPRFETNAEEALRNAEIELAASLKIVRSARKSYSAKPVTA